MERGGGENRDSRINIKLYFFFFFNLDYNSRIHKEPTSWPRQAIYPKAATWIWFAFTTIYLMSRTSDYSSTFLNLLMLISCFHHPLLFSQDSLFHLRWKAWPFFFFLLLIKTNHSFKILYEIGPYKNNEKLIKYLTWVRHRPLGTGVRLFVIVS